MLVIKEKTIIVAALFSYWYNSFVTPENKLIYIVYCTDVQGDPEKMPPFKLHLH